MSENHIPAPWTHHAGSGDIYKDGYLIASVRLNSHSIEPEERATAQHIVNCVNAMEGIENPSKLVEDFNSMKSLLKEMLMIWDRGDSVSANCVYPNAVRFALGVEPKAAERKKVVEEKEENLTATTLESFQIILGLDKTDEQKFKLIKGIVALHKREAQRLEFQDKRETEALIFSSKLWSIKEDSPFGARNNTADEMDSLKIQALSKALSSFP
jgi:hypothetical protein